MTIMPMMWGDINYEPYIVPNFNPKTPEQKTLYPLLTYLLYLSFIILAGILVKNILIGLAVGNISTVQRNARLKRYAMQVVFFTDMERHVPRSFIKQREVRELKFYPNKHGNAFFEGLKGFIGRGKVGGSVESFGNEEVLDDAANMQYLQQELGMLSRQLGVLVSRYELHREMMRIIADLFDTELFNKGKDDYEKEMESGDEYDEKDSDGLEAGADADEADATKFQSAAASAAWHAINKRLAGMKKPKTNIWVNDDDESTQHAKADDSENNMCDSF